MTKSLRQIRDEFDRIALSSAADDGAQPYDHMLTPLVLRRAAASILGAAPGA